jgi:hypothetical protein
MPKNIVPIHHNNPIVSLALDQGCLKHANHGLAQIRLDIQRHPQGGGQVHEHQDGKLC